MPVDTSTLVDILSPQLEETLIDERISHPERKIFLVIRTEYCLEKGQNPKDVETKLGTMFCMRVKYVPFLHRAFLWEYPTEKEAG